MKAIILAAGKGERLYPLTRNTPKSLLEIGNGITLIENQLMSLEKGGIKDVVLVLGYRADQVEAKIKTFNESSCNLTTLFNPFYDISNNLISLWIATSQMNEDFVIINGDDIFLPEIIRNMLEFTANKEICMAIDRKDVYELEDMKVIIKDERVVMVGKQIALNEANGESIGIMRVIGKSRKLFVKTLFEMVRKVENRDKFYLSVFQQIIDIGWPVYHLEVDQEDWGEVDLHCDLEMVRSNVKAFTKTWNF
jgi:L-glutamine-phosphate cytidylyltransferase